MSSNPDSNPLEQVQSILFGRQMAEITKRFDTLDARLTDKTNAVLDEVRARLADLEKASQERELALRHALDTHQKDGAARMDNLKSMLDAERTTWREHAQQLKDELAGVRTDDRESLSTMFMDVARRLGGNRSDG